MNFLIDGIFDEAEHRYLKPEELRQMGQYVSSISARMSTYRAVRDREIEIVQKVADQLELELPGVAIAQLERSLKNAMLCLRYCTMAMLTQNESMVQKQFLPWLQESVQLHNTAEIDAILFPLLTQELRLALNAQQMAMFEPFLALVQATPAEPEEDLLTVAGMF